MIHERAQFYMRNQKESENVDSFIRDLYSRAEFCDFGANRDNQIRDRIVIGLLDKEVSRKLQMKSDLTVDQAISIARQSETVKKAIICPI